MTATTSDLVATPLFTGLSEDQLRRVAAVLRPSRAEAGREILVEGAPGRSVFVLVRGTVETTKQLGVVGLEQAPRQKVLVRLSAPQFFGEMSLLEDAPRSATVRAATACELLELDRGGRVQIEGIPGAPAGGPRTAADTRNSDALAVAETACPVHPVRGRIRTQSAGRRQGVGETGAGRQPVDARPDDGAVHLDDEFRA